MFKRFAQEGNYSLVRIAAIQCLIDFVKVEKGAAVAEFEWLLEVVRSDNESLIRYKTLRLLAKNQPFKKMDSNLNTVNVRKTLWSIISEYSGRDSIKLFDSTYLILYIPNKHVIQMFDQRRCSFGKLSTLVTCSTSGMK